MVLQKSLFSLEKKNNAFWAAEIYNIEKAVFRQALSKLSPNFREKWPYINLIFKIHLFSSHILLLSRNFRKKNKIL